MTPQWSPNRLGNLTGKRIVVTGATNGVGLGTARSWPKAGAHVIMAVRNVDLGAQRAAEIGGSTAVMKLDLADLASVRAFAGALDDDIDILVNNAGALTQSRTETVDGFESTIGTNLLGPFALTNLVFGRVRSQIINVGSERTSPRRCDSTTCICARRSGPDGRVRAVETCGDVVGSGTGSQAARCALADRHATDASGMGGVEPVQRLR